MSVIFYLLGGALPSYQELTCYIHVPMKYLLLKYGMGKGLIRHFS